MLLVNSSTIAMGETATLRALVDQRPLLKGLPARMSELAKEIPRQAHFWGVYAGGPVDLPLSGNLGNVNKILGLIGSGTFYFDLSSGVTGTLTGLAASTQGAQQIHDGLVGMLGIGRMMAPKNQPEMARVFDGINVAEDGQRVTVKFAEPEDLAGTLAGMWLK